MQYFKIFILCFFLIGCASVTSDKDKKPLLKDASIETGRVTSLPPQTLAPGDCGLFIWTSGDKRNFIGFESAQKIKLVWNEKVVSVRRADKGDLDADIRTYFTSEDNEVTLSLRGGTIIAEGRRFSGHFSSKTKEGWERILPVVAVISCLPATELTP